MSDACALFTSAPRFAEQSGYNADAGRNSLPEFRRCADQ
jgi:hypothetical protein